MFGCEICAVKFPVEEYGGGTCPNCNAEYTFNEGYFLNLTEEQRELLKIHAVGWTKSLPTESGQYWAHFVGTKKKIEAWDIIIVQGQAKIRDGNEVWSPLAEFIEECGSMIFCKVPAAPPIPEAMV